MSITPASPTARTVALGNRQIHLHEFGAHALDRRRFGTQSRVWIFEDGELRHSFENTAKVMSRLNLMIDDGPLDRLRNPAGWRD